MTTDPQRGMDALGELEHGYFTHLYERVAAILDIGLTATPGEQPESRYYRIWRTPAKTGVPHYTASHNNIHHFLYGLAVGIQGDWSPDGDID